MKITILSGNPKKDGRCQSMIEVVKKGALEGGADVEEIRLIDYDFARCHVCGDGWGICREGGECSFGDDGFDEIRKRLNDSDAVVIATPVYWGETSELLKIVYRPFASLRIQSRRGIQEQASIVDRVSGVAVVTGY